MEKNKIGIITFHRSYNCGSMLQAYALQTVLKDYFHIESRIIDFSNYEQKRMYSILYFPRNGKELLRNILNLVFYRPIAMHNKDYEAFLADKLNCTRKKYFKLSELDESQMDFDLYITGSDQVWNIRAKDFDDAYFLPFVKEKPKIAYAVSLGATNPNMSDSKERYSTFIKSFNGVSVREKNAQKWIQDLSGRDVDICLDPTMLLKREEWDMIAAEREVDEKYLFWYAMTYKKDVMEKVLEIGQRYHLPIYVLDAKEWSRRGLYLHGIRLAPMGGPTSYLSMVKYADMVITSSFHGTVFCNIFQKNFWYLNIHDHNTQDDRASFLLQQLGLTDRYVNKKEITDRDLLEKPDYTKQNSLAEEVAHSMGYLKRYIFAQEN